MVYKDSDANHQNETRGARKLDLIYPALVAIPTSSPMMLEGVSLRIRKFQPFSKVGPMS